MWTKPDIELGHRVIGSFGSTFTSGSLGHHFDPVWDPGFSSLGKKCPKCKTYIWNAEMTKVIVRCLLLDWNHWISVRAMNFYLYLWLLKILWPENPSSHISRHLGFQRHRVNWVSGSLDSRGHWVTKCDPVPCLDTTGHTTSLVITVGDQENLAEYLVLCEYRIQRSFQALF